jgi:hypothetical protein
MDDEFRPWRRLTLGSAVCVVSIFGAGMPEHGSTYVVDCAALSEVPVLKSILTSTRGCPRVDPATGTLLMELLSIKGADEGWVHAIHPECSTGIRFYSVVESYTVIFTSRGP